MFVRPRSSRRRFGNVPAALGLFAVFSVALVATGQSDLSTSRPAESSVLPSATAPAGSGAAEPSSPGPSAPELSPDDPKFVTLLKLHQKGGPVMYVLDLCSVLALAIIFERLFSLRRSVVIPRTFLAGLRSVWKDPMGDRQRAIDYCRRHDSAMARMVVAFLKRLPRGFESAEKALEDAGGNEALRLRANLRFFYAIGACATLLGLIGTIAGMIKAFRQTALAGDAPNKVQLLSEGIYEAMVCTFGGLAVAILVTAFYYYFVGKVEKLVTEINDELTLFADEFGLAPSSPDELATTSSMPKL